MFKGLIISANKMTDWTGDSQLPLFEDISLNNCLPQSLEDLINIFDLDKDASTESESSTIKDGLSNIDKDQQYHAFVTKHEWPF